MTWVVEFADEFYGEFTELDDAVKIEGSAGRCDQATAQEVMLDEVR